MNEQEVIYNYRERVAIAMIEGEEPLFKAKIIARKEALEDKRYWSE